MLGCLHINVISEAALKARRIQELKIHKQLHYNIYSLTLIYSPSEDFKRVFMKNMFAKSNKAAFQQVVYYLLNILDSEAVKKNITPLPLYTPNLEAQFRGEVMKFINDLSSRYEYANIPVLLKSHLMSPGGFKFAKFILKLSQLVISIHLQKSKINTIFLFPIKCNKNSQITKICIENVKQYTRYIESETLQKSHELEEYCRLSRSEALAIIHEKQVVRTRLQQLESVVNNTNDLCTHSSDFSDINSSLIQSSLVSSQCLHLEESVSYLFNNEIVLKFNSNDLSVSTSLTCSIHNGTLNLSTYFENLGKYLITIRLQKPYISNFYLDYALQSSLKTNTWLLMLCKEFEVLREKSLELLCGTKNFSIHYKRKKNLGGTQADADSTEVLAVPLESSPESQMLVNEK